MKKILILLVATFVSISAFTQTQWNVDPYHASLNFNISHSDISLVNGKFMDYTGVLTTNGDALEKASFDFTVKVKSINTNVEDRDNHLRSPDFFDAEKYPNMTFKSTKVVATDKPDDYLLYGTLTIKDVTKEVVFNLHYGGKVKSDDRETIGMKAEATINRFDYNIDYDPTGGTVGKDVHIVLHGQFIKQ